MNSQAKDQSNGHLIKISLTLALKRYLAIRKRIKRNAKRNARSNRNDGREDTRNGKTNRGAK